MHSADKPHSLQATLAPSYVMDAGASKVPFARVWLLVESDDFDVMVHNHPADQRNQSRDDPILAGAVVPSGHDQSDAHGQL